MGSVPSRKRRATARRRSWSPTFSRRLISVQWASSRGRSFRARRVPTAAAHSATACCSTPGRSRASRARPACCSKRSKNCSPPLAGRKRAKKPFWGAVAIRGAAHSTAAGGCSRGSARAERGAQAARLGGRKRGRRVAAAQTLERVDQHRRDRQIAVPLVVGGDHVPGRVWRAAAREELLVGGDVAIPERPLLEIALRELPVLGPVGQALAEPPALRALADVGEEFREDRVVLGQDALEVVDL